jgi:ABC-2 type transport system permease protein
VPGLVAIIMTLIGALLTALVMAREWERGTMEALLVTPASMSEVLLGKLIAYFALGTGGMLLTRGHGGVAVRGAPARLVLGALGMLESLFLLAALGMGLMISTLARSQFVAGQIAIIATFLPAFLLSGFMFDIDSMPAVVQVITHVIVARYFVAIVQTLFLAGDVWAVVLPNAAGPGAHGGALPRHHLAQVEKAAGVMPC